MSSIQVSPQPILCCDAVQEHTTRTITILTSLILIMTNTIFALFYSAPLADLYSLSYLWISGLSFGAAIVVGVIASFALGNYMLLNYSILIVSNTPHFPWWWDAVELAACTVHPLSDPVQS